MSRTTQATSLLAAFLISACTGLPHTDVTHQIGYVDDVVLVKSIPYYVDDQCVKPGVVKATTEHVVIIQFGSGVSRKYSAFPAEPRDDWAKNEEVYRVIPTCQIKRSRSSS